METTEIIKKEPGPLVLQRQPTPGDLNPVESYLESVAKSSRRPILQRLERAAQILSDGRFGAEDLPWFKLRNQHLTAIKSRLVEEGLKPPTVNAILSAVKSVLKQCWKMELIDIETYHRAIEVPPVRGSTLPRGRGLDSGEISNLFKICAKDAGPSGIRDSALLAVLYGGGIRRAEAASLSLGDLDQETGAIKVFGKGGKERLVYLPSGALEAVRAWIEVRGPEPGPLFCPCSKGKTGKVTIGPISDQAIYNCLIRRARAAGVDRFSPHDLRRSFVSDLLDRGADLVHVQKLAGHSSPETTSRYDRRPEHLKRKTVEKLFVPFKRKRAQ